MNVLSRKFKPQATIKLGFTLVEIMVVVAVIGLLSAIAIPNFLRARSNAANARYSSDVNVVTSAFIEYSFARGHYPPDATPGVMPDGMADYLLKVHWDKPDAMGGKWDWDNKQFGVKIGVSTYEPTASKDQLQRYDALVDDGDLSTGDLRQRTSGYITVIEP